MYGHAWVDDINVDSRCRNESGNIHDERTHIEKMAKTRFNLFPRCISVGHPGRRIQRRCPKLLRSRSYVFSVKIQDGRHAKSSQVAEILTFV